MRTDKEFNKNLRNRPNKNTKALYGLNQEVMGKRSSEIFGQSVKEIAEAQATVQSSIYYDASGNAIYGFKTINGISGEVVAGTNNDSYSFVSSDSSIDIVGTNSASTMDVEVNATTQNTAIDTRNDDVLKPWLKKNSVALISRTSNIDSTAVATTSLYTVPDDTQLLIQHIVIICTQFTVGAKSVEAVFDVGGNSASWDDYLSAATNVITAANTYVRESAAFSGTPVVLQDAGDVVTLDITTASDATEELWLLDIYGTLI